MSDRPLHEREHYVAQSYLRGFGLPSSQIWCFDKTSGRSFRTSTVNVAQEKGFFEMYDPQGQRETLEGLMARLDQEWKATIDAVIAAPYIGTVNAYRPALAQFCAVQLMRSPSFRDLLHRILLRHGQEHDRNSNVITATHALFLLKEAKHVADLLQGLEWALFYNPTSVPFWTSDNPIVLSARDPAAVKSPIVDLGLSSKGIRIHIPVQAMGPGLALCLSSPDNPLPASWQSLLVVDQVWQLNYQQIHTARRLVFSPSDNFDPARRYLATRSLSHEQWSIIPGW